MNRKDFEKLPLIDRLLVLHFRLKRWLRRASDPMHYMPHYANRREAEECIRQMKEIHDYYDDLLKNQAVDDE